MRKQHKNYLLVIGFSGLSICLAYAMYLLNIKQCYVANNIAGVFLGLTIPQVLKSLQDLFDTTDWKVSQRKLKRGGFIKDDTIVRISFAYLFRIKIGNQYLLVKNDRGTDKYQPVGGVYKFTDSEKLELKNRYQVKDDNKIPIDQSSRNDYRLRMENKYLRRFVRRFDRKAQREKIDNLSREFIEELVEKGILNWTQITYRFCGRYMTELRYGEHFQIYELLLADVVELLPTPEQEEDLMTLTKQQSSLYCFATEEQISSLGIDTDKGGLKEIIGDHSKKILQENEGKLMDCPGVGEKYTVSLNEK